MAATSRAARFTRSSRPRMSLEYSVRHSINPCRSFHRSLNGFLFHGEISIKEQLETRPPKAKQTPERRRSRTIRTLRNKFPKRAEEPTSRRKKEHHRSETIEILQNKFPKQTKPSRGAFDKGKTAESTLSPFLKQGRDPVYTHVTA